MAGFAVIIENLESASKKLHHVARPLFDYDYDPGTVTGPSFGHNELAAWFHAVCDQCDKAGQALHDGAEALAVTLDSQAGAYRSADEYSMGLCRSMPELVPAPIAGDASAAPRFLRRLVSR